jgi:hypothetical protein
MLTEQVIDQMRKCGDDEDGSLWKQGDLLRDNPLSKAEMKKLAELLQRKVSTLEMRRRVSTETPNDKRRKEYSWTIYAKFVQIEDQTIRWQLMFSRLDWTYESATKAVRDVLYGDRGPRPDSTTKAMMVGDILVKGRLDKSGVFTVKVWLGEEYDVDHQQTGKVTSLTFTP